MKWVYYIPIGTLLMSMVFSFVLFRHFKNKHQATYVLWWLIGVLSYGAGTLTESLNTLIGWSEMNFKWWYITGALLGGAPLAQGTVYLLLSKKAANFLSLILVSVIVIAGIFVWLSPVNLSLVEPHRMSGKVLEWQWVRSFSPFINIYALAFLVGGAIYSAVKYFQSQGSSSRFWGNLLIAFGGLLPGIGGSFTRFGYVEVLYITEFTGLVLIIWAYRLMRKDSSKSIHSQQKN
ncbi:MAG: hypothetical protein NBV77_00270 [Bacteroidia bacterium]|nr:hypothetical protein [Bacteroidia bacterium]